MKGGNSISSNEWISFQWWNTISNLFLVLNSVLAFLILFVGRKRASSTWAWIMILLFLPIFGFLLYLLFGLPHKNKQSKYSAVYMNAEIHNVSQQQLFEIDQHSFKHSTAVSKEWQSLIRMNLRNGTAPLTFNNHIQIYTDGKRKFDKLFLDIDTAKHHIHLQYYIFKDDKIGNCLLDILTKKAKQGIKILVLYDDISSKSLPKKFFDALIQAGGRVAVSMPSRIPFANPRVNYRNHRKIIVVDGNIGYIGGFNVGDEYLGEKGKHGYWRDTHLRIEGDAVNSLQHQFLTDWNQATKNHPVMYADVYFPKGNSGKGIALQVLVSGPNESIDQIKNGFLQLIAKAQHSIYIQTPYFIPDEAVLEVI